MAEPVGAVRQGWERAQLPVHCRRRGCLVQQLEDHLERPLRDEMECPVDRVSVYARESINIGTHGEEILDSTIRVVVARP